MATFLATRCMVGWATREKHLLSSLTSASSPWTASMGPMGLPCLYQHQIWSQWFCMCWAISPSFCRLPRPSQELLHTHWALYQQIKHPCFKNAAESINDAGQSCMWGLFCLTSCSDCSVQHIPRAAQCRRSLPQEPCKHPGQPAGCFPAGAGISLGKCSLLRGFYSSE